MELIEKQAVNIVGPDPCDVGGIAELKWVAEYADLHGILMAPHGTGDGLIGLAALVQVAATLPTNYIAFEYPTGQPDWWYDIVEGLPDPIVHQELHRRVGQAGHGRDAERGQGQKIPGAGGCRLFRLRYGDCRRMKMQVGKPCRTWAGLAGSLPASPVCYGILTSSMPRVAGQSTKGRWRATTSQRSLTVPWSSTM